MRKWVPVLLLCVMVNIAIAQSEECDYEVEIMLNNTQFTNQDFEWRMRAINQEGQKTNITGIAQIKRDDDVIKTYKPWTSSSISKKKTSTRYSPNLDHGKYTLLAQISVECRDINVQNNFDTKEFIILGGADEEKISEKSEPLLDEEIEETANSVIVDEEPKKAAETRQNPEPETQKYSKIMYESSSQKSINLILPLLLAASIIINIALIWKKP